MGQQGSSINEIVALLEKHGGEILPWFKSQVPDAIDHLSPGLTLGPDAANATAKLDAEVCLAGLQIAIRVCQRASDVLRRRMRITNTSALVGQMLTATAGASIFGVLAADAPRLAEYAVGALALLGALITTVSHFFSKMGGAAAVAETYAAITINGFECARVEASLSGRLRARSQTDEVWNEIRGLVARANELSREIVRLASSAGIGGLNVGSAPEILATVDVAPARADLAAAALGVPQPAFRRFQPTIN